MIFNGTMLSLIVHKKRSLKLFRLICLLIYVIHCQKKIHKT
uniref:Uncharacterized protein n=1 Tax=Anguilla anguilla TaxID=7936 RepID=A0A0E9RJC9_ANGAN